MSFASWIYGSYLCLTVIVYWFLPKSFRSFFLFLAGLVFMLYSVPLHGLLLLCLSTYIHLLTRIKKTRTNLLLGICLPLAVLAYFKYIGLLNDIIDKMSEIGFNWTYKLPDAALPLGISFFTFKLIHYIVDTYRGSGVSLSYLQFLSYIFFFPILPLGPIERHQNFANQSNTLNGFKAEYLVQGLERIMTGLIKKLVLADTLAIYAGNLQVTGQSSFVYWVAAYSFAFQIFFDFSGYSDMAIGSARLFGYRIMENFNNPYLKRNLSLFWKNWHISLTSWFTEYIFIPLGGSRGTFFRTVINTFVVMAVTGMWHGAALHFLAWGLFHAVGLVILRLYGKHVCPRLPAFWVSSKTSEVFSTLLTFHYVLVGWVFFAVDFGQSFYVLRKLFFLG